MNFYFSILDKYEHDERTMKPRQPGSQDDVKMNEVGFVGVRCEMEGTAKERKEQPKRGRVVVAMLTATTDRTGAY